MYKFLNEIQENTFKQTGTLKQKQINMKKGRECYKTGEVYEKNCPRIEKENRSN